MRTISSASIEPIHITAAAVQSGAAVDLSGDAVSVAYMSSDSTPGAGDWIAATWETDATTDPDSYSVVSVVGTGATDLAAGTWRVWVKIIHGAYTIVRRAGLIKVV